MNYEIKNSFIKAKIKSFGAELNSLQKIENDFEYIWQANSQYWARHSPVLFPIVGRLKNDSYFYKDKKYYIQSGAGIVYDSDPEKEYLEILHKRKSLTGILTDCK